MPSRRIASYPNLAPIQELSVNPFSSFNSNVVNKLTRIVSYGRDIIVNGLDVHSTNNLELIPNSSDLVSSYWDSTRWVYDTDYIYPTLSADQTVLSGFHVTIDHNKPYESTKLTYRIPSETYPIRYFYGKDTTKVIECSFNILSGNPRAIVIDVDGDRKIIDYPRGSGSKYTCQLKHNFLSSSKDVSISDTAVDYLDITFYFILQANDPACSYETNNSEGSTYIVIGKPEVTILSQPLDRVNCISSGSIDGNYSYQYIHPSNNIAITDGILIKDDVMLNPQILDKTSVDKAMIRLNISDEKSWIFGENYSEEYENRFIGNQKVYFLNGRDDLIEYTGQFINGNLKVRGKFLDVGKNKSEEEIEVGLINDDEISDADAELDILRQDSIPENVDILSFNVPQTLIGNYHGKIGLWCYDDGDKKIVFKKTIFNLIDTDEGKAISGETINISRTEIPQIINSSNVSNIKCYLTLGPIKVSGDISQYDQQKIAWSYVVCYYSYYRHPEPNISYYGLLKDYQLNDLRYREDYVVLAKLRMVDKDTFDIIDYQPRQQYINTNKNIVAKDVNYENGLPLDDGFTERGYWRDTLDGEISVPENVSDALSILAKRRIDDMIREDDKLDYKKNLTDNSSDTTKVLVSPVENNSKTATVVDSQNGNLITYKFDESEKNIVFGNTNGVYVFENNNNLFTCIDLLDNRFSQQSPTPNGSYWILKKDINNTVHEQDSDSCILEESEWVVIKRDDITYSMYSYFRDYQCNYILAKYNRIDIQDDGNWKFSLEDTLIYISFEDNYPLSFMDRNNASNSFTFDVLSSVNKTINSNMWISAKVPTNENQDEDSLVGFGTKANTANLDFIKYNNTVRFSDDDNPKNYNGNNLKVSTLSKFINRIPNDTVSNRLLVWSDNVGNIRNGNDKLTENRVSIATDVCVNGLVNNNNITQYSSDTGAIKDSGVSATKLTRLDSGFIGPNSKVDKHSYTNSNPETDADSSYVDTTMSPPICRQMQIQGTDKWVSSYTKSYTTTSDGVLMVSIKWDCHDEDGLKFCIYNNSNDSLIADIRVAPSIETTNSKSTHISFSMNLLSGVKVRFEQTNESNPLLAEAEGCYLEYVFFSN